MSLSTDGDRVVGVGKMGSFVSIESGDTWENLTKITAEQNQYSLLENEENLSSIN